jgi:hypothetical protein
LDFGCRRLDFWLVAEDGRPLEIGAGRCRCGWSGPFRAAGGAALGAGGEVQVAIESMIGARFVHDTLERCGWEVGIADAVKVKGLAPLACKTDKIDAWVLVELSRCDLGLAIWLPGFGVRQERERGRWRLHLVKHRS